MDLISVIVPVYKVEPYLDRCVQSIVDQTYQNLEIILVDDGSPDNCPAMCDAWAEKDSRIRVIHKENGGLSDARNAGMAIAAGDYIAFVDSDDWIDAQMYQYLYEAIAATDSDIAACGAKRVWPDGRPKKELRSVNNYCILEPDSIMEAFITSNGLIQTVWNKLYKRNVIKNILFPVGLIHEDEFWTWQAMARARRVVTIQGSYYNYLQRDNSIMGVGFTANGLLVVQAKTDRQGYIEKNLPSLANTGRMDLIYTCMHLGVQILKSMRWKEAAPHMNYLKATINSYPIYSKYLRQLTWKKRVHLQMIQHFFVPICFLHTI